MNNSFKSQNAVPQPAVPRIPAESFGRVARCTPVATLVLLAPGSSSANDADISSRSLHDFGPGDSPLLHRTAGLRDLTADCLRWMVSAIRRIFDTWSRHRLAQATARTLQGLDARTLRDIGIDRSEILSVAVEIAGAAEATRLHAVRTARGR